MALWAGTHIAAVTPKGAPEATSHATPINNLLT